MHEDRDVTSKSCYDPCDSKYGEGARAQPIRVLRCQTPMIGRRASRPATASGTACVINQRRFLFHSILEVTMARRFKMDITFEGDLDDIPGAFFLVDDWEEVVEQSFMRNKHYNTSVEIKNVTVDGKPKPTNKD
ncbi:MAG: hypothetical protein V3R78_06385 [Thermodesulfobacteriota bacterium]